MTPRRASSRTLGIQDTGSFAVWAKYRANPGLIHPGDIVRVK